MPGAVQGGAGSGVRAGSSGGGGSERVRQRCRRSGCVPPHLPPPSLHTHSATDAHQRRTLLHQGVTLSKAILGVGEDGWQLLLLLGLRASPAPASPTARRLASHRPRLARSGILALPRVFSLLGIGTGGGVQLLCSLCCDLAQLAEADCRISC